MLISRRAFRLLVALSIGTAQARSYATEPEWESGAEAYSAAPVCPYGACHNGRDYLADPVPAPVDTAAADVPAADSTTLEAAPAPLESPAAESPVAEIQPITVDPVAAEPSTPVASETAADQGCGYDGTHPAYGKPYYGHPYYQHLQYAHGHAGYGYDAATAEQTCEYPETAPTATEPVADAPIAEETIADETVSDAPIAAEQAIVEDAVPPTPVEELLPAEPQTMADEAANVTEEPEYSEPAPAAVVELAEEPADVATDAVVADDSTPSTEPVVESLVPSPYPYGHGHPVYSSKGYPFHYLNQDHNAHLVTQTAESATENAAAATDDAATTAVEPTAVEATPGEDVTVEATEPADAAAESAHSDSAPEYDWEASANANCDQDETLLQQAQTTETPASVDGEDFSDVLPYVDLPNYDYLNETESTDEVPAEPSASFDVDRIEFDGCWPADEPINIGLIHGSISLMTQITVSVRDGLQNANVPTWLSDGWKSADAAAPAAVETDANSATIEPEPQFEQQTDLGAQRDAVLSLARSIDRLGASLQQLAQRMERIADDDVIGRLGTPTDRIER